MKQLLKIALGLVLCLGGFTACDDDENVAVSGFSLSKTEIAANAEGGKEIVTISSEGEWVAKSSEPWLSISPANGFGNTECVITIDQALQMMCVKQKSVSCLRDKVRKLLLSPSWDTEK